MAGQELLWKSASLGEFSGQCQGGVNKECYQKWCLPESDQIRVRRVKKGEKWHPQVFLTQEKVPTDLCISSRHPKISQCITITCDPDSFQTAASVPGLRKSPTDVSYSSLTLQDVSPIGFQNWMLWGLLFLVQVLQAGTQALYSLEVISAIVISLPLVSHFMGSEG